MLRYSVESLITKVSRYYLIPFFPNLSPVKLLVCFLVSIKVNSFTLLEQTQPFLLLLLQKKGGKFDYLRLLIIQIPAITASATIIAETITANSLVINGASVGSGSINPPAAASSTPIAVSAYEL